MKILKSLKRIFFYPAVLIAKWIGWERNLGGNG